MDFCGLKCKSNYKRSKTISSLGIQYVKVIQSCPTLCDLMYYTVHGILQARILEWVAIPFSGDIPNPGIEPRSPALQADSSPAEPPRKSWNSICSGTIFNE